MSVLKYKDPQTGEVKTVGYPQVDAYNKAEVDVKIANHTDNKNNPHGVTISQIGAAPSGYGLGGVSTLTANLNENNQNGWYFYGASALNIPKHIQYGCLLVVNRSGTETEVVQTAFSTVDGTKAQRTYRNSTDGWSEWEYENPPMATGVEYRTTERWLGKPVYVKIVPFGALPNNTSKTTAHNIENVKLVLDVFGHTSYGSTLNYNGVAMLYANTTGITIKTNGDLSAITANVAIKYTKSTD